MDKLIDKFFEKYKNMPLPVKASVWFTICSILQKCISFITVPIFTRLLTTEQYGLFNVYQSWMSIIVIFATLNLQYGVFNNAMIKYEDDRDTCISSLQGLSTILTLIIFIVYLVSKNFWNSLFKLPTILMLCMFAEIFTAPALGFWSGKQRFDYKYKKLVIITFGMSVVSPIIGVLAVLSTDNKGVMRILSAALVNVIVCSIIYVLNMIKGKKFFVKKYWKYALAFNVPLIPYYLSQMVLNQSDRIIINNISGTDKAGLYSVAYSFALILTFILNAINNSFVPWTYKKLKSGRYSDIANISDALAIFIGVSLILLIAFAPEMIRIVAAPEYYESVWVVPPVSASLFFLFLAQLYINVEWYFEENFLLVKASLLSAVINIILNIIFIRIFGYVAAGYTTLICYIIFVFNNYYYMKKVCKKHIESDSEIKIYNGKNLVIISSIFLLMVFTFTLLYRFMIIRYLIIILILMIILIKRNYILEKIKKIRAEKNS
ncbi:Polysaccharide biosynthesis protein [uncultured Clostridium sp.]|uniref:lipopolysaccharide biosynthesis protein n=1 Tax=uncultured Clostridium sp. TaxID=59620 RepID=UPI000820B93B|nr:oligosaccharide flippase family protein [uncultured Clostridium sp.]SCJ41485.1 Polysaccharide biosynthesis protein [uncultured Clostridium sp.]